MQEAKIRRIIIKGLKDQGFTINGKSIIPPPLDNKSKIRALHTPAVEHKLDISKKYLAKHENQLLKNIANGKEISPLKIQPKIIEVKPNTMYELLFRYVSLHWSIPVSSGYGRRLRFVVLDEQNSKLIGIFGLGDPVYNLSARDQWIGWTKTQKKKKLQNVMDAFVLGAVPPYSMLLCGKMVAMCLTSNEVRKGFYKKYGLKKSLIKRRKLDSRLALITTLSALGKSSIYNRIKYNKQLLYRSVGFTQGSGEFHFSNGLYDIISEYANKYCKPTAKQEEWGTGFRNRREIVRKTLSHLGLSCDWLYHGIKREIFVIPLAKNTRQFLQGKHKKLLWNNHSTEQITDFFLERWLLPRAKHNKNYKEFNRDTYAFWNGKN